MILKFHYEILGFSPRNDLTLGGYGFSIYLDKELAKKAFEQELTEYGYKNLTEMATNIIIDVGLAKKDEIIHPPYNFFPNKKNNLTCLLQFCDVPGNACDLGASWDQIEDLKRDSYKNYIEYHPHNVDTSRQAYALLSIWLNWEEHIKALLEYNQNV